MSVVIGDSLLNNISAVTNASVMCYPGLSIFHALQEFDLYFEKSIIENSKRLIIVMGTNDDRMDLVTNIIQLDLKLSTIQSSPKHYYWIVPKVSMSFRLALQQMTFKTLILVDFFEYNDADLELFTADGIHLNKIGSHELVDCIVNWMSDTKRKVERKPIQVDYEKLVRLIVEKKIYFPVLLGNIIDRLPEGDFDIDEFLVKNFQKKLPFHIRNS